jgi:hypothetical protein
LTEGGDQPAVRFHLTNTGLDDAGIHQLVFYWDAYDSYDPQQVLKFLYLEGNSSYMEFQEDSPTGDIFGFPNSFLPAGTTLTISYNFQNVDPAWPGDVPADSFALALTLTNGCVLVAPGFIEPPVVTATPTPTATRTPTPSATRTPSRTPTICYDC